MATITLPRTPLPTKRKPFTYEDYVRLPDSPYREEVLGGELTVGPSPSFAHQAVSTRLVSVLGPHVLEGDLGELCHAPTDVVLSDDTVVVPDLAFVSRARERIIRTAGIFGPPDLIIEILSPSAPERDTEVKRRIYAQHGVQHYWIVDPQKRRIRVLRLTESGEYEAVGEYAGEQTFAAEPFAELQIALGRIWPD